MELNHSHGKEKNKKKMSSTHLFSVCTFQTRFFFFSTASGVECPSASLLGLLPLHKLVSWGRTNIVLWRSLVSHEASEKRKLQELCRVLRFVSFFPPSLVQQNLILIKEQEKKNTCYISPSLFLFFILSFLTCRPHRPFMWIAT